MLFGGQSRVLNAGGDESLVSDSNLPKDAAGREILRPNHFRSDAKATTENIEKVFKELQNTNKERVFFFWGDHGDSDSIATWDVDGDGSFKYSRLRTLLKRLPKSTLIQSVHSHCFSGDSIVDQERAAPQDQRDLHEYMIKHYPENICDLAEAPRGEIGYSTQSFRKIISGRNTTSLQDLKDAWADHGATLPSLTSDSILEDLQKVLCGDSSNKTQMSGKVLSCTPSQEEVFSHELTQSVERALVVGTTQELCGCQFPHEIEELHNSYLTFFGIDNDLDRLIEECHQKILSEDFPELFKKIEMRDAELTVLRKQMAVAIDPTEKERISAELLRVWNADRVDAELWSKKVKEDRKPSWECLKSEYLRISNELPDLKNFAAGKDVNSQRFWEEAAASADKYCSFQTTRKHTELKLQKLRRDVIEPWLKATHTEAWKHYEKIRECETTPFH